MPELSGAPPRAHRPAFLGVDVGGTFTDLVFFTPEGDVRCVKVPSTPAQPGRSTLAGLDEIRRSELLDDLAWRTLHHTHSSTVATNALIERTGAVVGMLTTSGFRDLFELQRLVTSHPLRFDARRPIPLIPRHLVRDVAGRIDAGGREVTPLDVAGVIEAARALRAEGAEILVVCFLHSYRNQAHERAARAALLEALPGLPVELSSDIWPQAREFERATLTAVNAHVRPIVESYLSDLERGLTERSVLTPVRVSRSNGGMELAATMRRRPVTALLSGPAAGVAGAAGEALGAGWIEADLMTLDVGGTSADIGVIRTGRPVLSSEEHVADFPLLLPTVAVSSIGAGGGSVLWVDRTGTLRVGPRSVGADPGPVSYGAPGAAQPALTDAFLQAGILASGQRLGGRLGLQAAPATAALTRLGESLGQSADEVADGSIRIAVAMMAAEATSVLARRGVDVPTFRMVAFGGAGPTVAALLAEAVHIDEVLIPTMPGALSALGAARARLEGDLVEPLYVVLGQEVAGQVAAALKRLLEQVEDWLREETATLAIGGSRIEIAAEMRYGSQGYDVAVPLDAAWLRDGRIDRVAAAFHAAHEDAFGHKDERAEVRLQELRAHVVGEVVAPGRPPMGWPETPSEPTRRELRLRARTMTAAVHQRAALVAGTRLTGPSIVEQMDTTTLLPPGWTALVLPSGAMTLRREP